MDRKNFGIAIKALSANYGLNLKSTNKEDQAHIRLIFDVLNKKGFTDQDIEKATIGIMAGELSLYGQMPQIAMFLKYAGKQELTIEQQAQIQVQRIIDASACCENTIFDNSTTNAVAANYGLGKINNHLTNDWMDFRKSKETIRKELVALWLIYHEEKKEQCTLVYNSSRFNDSIHYVGNKQKCLELMEQTTINNFANDDRKGGSMLGDVLNNNQIIKK